MCSKPSTTKRSAAWCHRGSSRMKPPSLWRSKARTAPLGSTSRRAVTVRSPSRFSFELIEKRDWSDRIGVLEENVKHPFFPLQFRIVRQRWPGDVRKRRLVRRRKRSIGRQGDADGDDSRQRQDACPLRTDRPARPPTGSRHRGACDPPGQGREFLQLCPGAPGTPCRAWRRAEHERRTGGAAPPVSARLGLSRRRESRGRRHLLTKRRERRPGATRDGVRG